MLAFAIVPAAVVLPEGDDCAAHVAATPLLGISTAASSLDLRPIDLNVDVHVGHLGLSLELSAALLGAGTVVAAAVPGSDFDDRCVLPHPVVVAVGPPPSALIVGLVPWVVLPLLSGAAVATAVVVTLAVPVAVGHHRGGGDGEEQGANGHPDPNAHRFSPFCRR